MRGVQMHCKPVALKGTGKDRRPDFQVSCREWCCGSQHPASPPDPRLHMRIPPAQQPSDITPRGTQAPSPPYVRSHHGQLTPTIYLCITVPQVIQGRPVRAARPHRHLARRPALSAPNTSALPHAQYQGNVPNERRASHCTRTHTLNCPTRSQSGSPPPTKHGVWARREIWALKLKFSNSAPSFSLTSAAS